MQRFLAEGRLRRQKTGRLEIRRLLQVTARDLSDSCVEGLSADRRFATRRTLAELAATPPRWPLMAEAYRRYVQRQRNDARIWLELACAEVQMGQPDRALESLRQAVVFGGEVMRDSIRNDRRLDPLRSREAFQKLAPAAAPFAPPRGLIPF